MRFWKNRRNLLTILISLAAFSYVGIVLCTVGQICFRIDDPALSSRLDAELLAVPRVRSVNRRHSNAEKYDPTTSRRSTRAPQNHRSKIGRSDLTGSERESHLFQPWSNVPLALPRRQDQPLFNCSSISRMKIRSKIGHGVAKETFVGEIEGVRVAIKMVTRRIHLVRSCLDKIRRRSGDVDTTGGRPHFREEGFRMRLDESEEFKKEAQECYVKPTAKLMKEVLLSMQLQHPNLVSLLGFCVRSEESESTDLAEHGVISVFELGHRFLLDNLQILPWQTKLRHAIEMSDLLHYLQNSPLGPVAVLDLTEGNLVMAGDSIKLVDLDDFHSQEPECHVVRNGTEPKCPLGTMCSRAICEGHNARANLKVTNRLIFKRLLFPLAFPDSVLSTLGRLNAQLDSLTLTAFDLRHELLRIKSSLKGYDDL